MQGTKYVWRVQKKGCLVGVDGHLATYQLLGRDARLSVSRGPFRMAPPRTNKVTGSRCRDGGWIWSGLG